MQSGEELRKLTVPLLKNILREQGKKVGGRKEELIQRILGSDATKPTATPAASAYIPSTPVACIKSHDHLAAASPSVGSIILQPIVVADSTSTSTSTSTSVSVNTTVGGVPRVVNLRAKELRRNGYQNVQEWLDVGDTHVYIGRAMRISLGGGNWAYLKNSKWGNPFKGERSEVVRQFEEHARATFTREDFRELEGKVLGCWCHPESCHGDILIKLYMEYI